MGQTIEQPVFIRFYQSPIGKKLVTGVTGLGLALFALAHMLGNLLMFAGHDAYNTYAFYLERLGPVFWAIELVLLAVFVLHAATGIYIAWQRRRSRPVGYTLYAGRGAPSLQSPSSRTMIVTGSIMAVFLVIHLLNFKFGPYYTTALAGREVRDLARLVVEKFQHPSYVIGYISVVVLLGWHLRHGLWSALQSLGLMTKSIRMGVYGLSLLGAIAIAIGFILLPLAIYCGFVT